MSIIYPKCRGAEFFADIAHSSIGQKRKYTDDPYIIHPRNVAYLVEIAGGTNEMIKAAYLHDVLEDVYPNNPLFSYIAIEEQFGETVADLVDELTDKSTVFDGNRETRKEIDRNRIELISPQAKTIKLADLIDNSLTITFFDPNFSKIYLKEKRSLLDVLKDATSQTLWNMANDILIRNGY